jgi:hypothetical protein
MSIIMKTNDFALLWRRKSQILAICFLLFFINVISLSADSLQPLQEGKIPATLTELWAGFDPQKEPLDTQVVKEWEQDDVICRVVLFRIGTFKGKNSIMLGIYGFPKGGKTLPGLVQIHGGGQNANLNAVTTNAKRGYACISINWGGNPISIPGGYNGPNTDWGAIDATQNGHNSHYGSLEPDNLTVDSVQSGRNNNWFLLTLATRRTLTFLEQQPEVDGSKLGVYGHSMGGNLSLYTPAVDDRVKAAAPSCGGGTGDASDNIKNTPFGNGAYASQFKCPVIFLNPANDHHGSIEGIERTVSLMPSKEYRYTRAPQLGHRDTAEHLVCGPLWFDQWLKGIFTFPQIPEIAVDLNSTNGVPVCRVTPDTAMRILAVEIYYTQYGEDKIKGQGSPCWRYVQPTQNGNTWTSQLPLFTIDKPIWVYANVTYPLDKPVTGAGYYYGIYTVDKFSLASKMLQISADSMQHADIKATDKASLVIESFDKDWEKGWYSYEQAGSWPYRTNKLHDPKWAYPAGAKLALDVISPRPAIITVTIDDYDVSFECNANQRRTIIMSPGDFKRKDQSLTQFGDIKELTLDFDNSFKNDKNTNRTRDRKAEPIFRNLRWEYEQQ